MPRDLLDLVPHRGWRRANLLAQDVIKPSGRLRDAAMAFHTTENIQFQGACCVPEIGMWIPNDVKEGRFVRVSRGCSLGAQRQGMFRQ